QGGRGNSIRRTGPRHQRCRVLDRPRGNEDAGEGLINMYKLFVKNMVCDRCVMVVNQELEKLGIKPEQVTLGEVTLAEELDEDKLRDLDEALEKVGFERIDDRRARLIENIKKHVIESIHH